MCEADGLPEHDRAGKPAARVLVVEDHPVNRLVILGMLRKLGYEAESVENGIEALEATEKERFAAVLMDCQMPLLDGYDATRMIRERERQEGAGRIPIIAVTASVMKEDRERAESAGMDAFVPKPIQIEVLEDTLNRCIAADQAGDPEAAASSDPPAGFRRLTELEELVGPEGMKELYDIFFSDSARVLELLDSALDQGDAPTFGTHAHGLKGSCANVGAEELKELALEMEMRGREGRLDDAGPLIRRFRQALDAARRRMSA